MRIAILKRQPWTRIAPTRSLSCATMPDPAPASHVSYYGSSVFGNVPVHKLDTVVG
jgi:hypothetical protein